MGRFFPAAPQMLIIIINFLYQTRFQQNVPERCGLRFLKKKRIQDKNSISNSDTILEVGLFLKAAFELQFCWISQFVVTVHYFVSSISFSLFFLRYVNII